jgi:lincosamide nucleotidyltransferase A/C/D/E
MMSPSDVIEILDIFSNAGIVVWLDGGWGVDALLHEQTRLHDDLDLAIDRRDCERAASSLRTFTHAQDITPGLPTRLVLRDENGRQVDIHLLDFDEDGNGWMIGPDGEKSKFPAADLAGQGLIAGRQVRCISADLQLIKHSGYTNHGPDEFDYRDMRALADRFGLILPPEYARIPNWRHSRRAGLGDGALR